MDSLSPIQESKSEGQSLRTSFLQLLFYPLCHIYFRQVCSDDGDAVVIVTMLMALDDLTSVTVGLKLED